MAGNVADGPVGFRRVGLYVCHDMNHDYIYQACRVMNQNETLGHPWWLLERHRVFPGQQENLRIQDSAKSYMDFAASGTNQGNSM